MAHLIVFSHLRWHFVHQRPQHLLSRLAPHHPVIYVEEPVETHGLPHLEVIEVMPHVTVLRPHTPVHTPGFHDEQFELLEPLLHSTSPSRTSTKRWLGSIRQWPCL